MTNIENLKERIAAGHTLRAHVFVNVWQDGSGWSHTWQMDILDSEEYEIAKSIAEGNYTVEDFVNGLEDPLGCNDQCEVRIIDEDDEDDFGNPKEVWSDTAWGTEEDEEEE